MRYDSGVRHLQRRLKNDLPRDLAFVYFDEMAPDYDDLEVKIAGWVRDYIGTLLKLDLIINW